MTDLGLIVRTCVPAGLWIGLLNNVEFCRIDSRFWAGEGGAGVREMPRCPRDDLQWVEVRGGCGLAAMGDYVANIQSCFGRQGERKAGALREMNLKKNKKQDLRTTEPGVLTDRTRRVLSSFDDR